MEEIMKRFKFFLLSFLMVVPAGCAGLDFGADRGLIYYTAKPYFFVTTTKDCVTTATVVMLPAEQKVVGFRSGYGTADLSITLSNGMITTVGQKTDTQIPQTITALTGAAALGIKSFQKIAKEAVKPACTEQATLYPIIDGRPALNQALVFPIRQ
jgi:hypothetical protein